ncbi:hypothetical protein PF006_g11391 [Phytophthora fragariae]|uniref:Uncharacterized protein n=1 Tax=Phytophthora fragariae TaxID=53985 RepID=A0A6A3TWH4_9STRA|nr:hypothetical protein PF006_g11391 [Phytophthora fragariae]
MERDVNAPLQSHNTSDGWQGPSAASGDTERMDAIAVDSRKSVARKRLGRGIKGVDLEDGGRGEGGTREQDVGRAREAGGRRLGGRRTR